MHDKTKRTLKGEIIKCPVCSGENINRAGFSLRDYQMVYCLDCRRTSTTEYKRDEIKSTRRKSLVDTIFAKYIYLTRGQQEELHDKINNNEKREKIMERENDE